MKRRIFAAVLCFAILFCCAAAANADSTATFVENITTVTSDGTCMVTLRVNIHLDSPNEKLTFPVPLGAKDIEVNNSSAKTSKTANAIEVDLSNVVSGMIGDYTVKIEYTMSDVIKLVEEKTGTKMVLELPLLAGFTYPVKSMEFAITLPGQVGDLKNTIGFNASYQQSTAASNIDIAVDGNMISGVVKNELKDHETLTLTMTVNEEMFGGVSTFQRTGNPEIVPMAICAGLALIYWLLFLRTFPIIRTRQATPPEGVCAGEMGCRLTFAGADLTMMVFHWAQLGYILIHLDDNGRVWLHKRMEMGNERSLFEIKAFRSLFGRRRAVDGTGFQYARLCRKFAQQIPGERAMCKASSGNTKIFRFLSCGVLVFGGICLAMNMTGILVLQILLAIILAVLAAVSSWHIQQGMYNIHLRYKLPLYLSLGLTALWLILGLLAGQFVIALCAVLAQLLAGLAVAYGGRRSELGRQNASQILGLRQYLKRISKEDLHRIQQNDPEYFFNMIPFALTLGVDRAFAANFGRKKLQDCPYLVTGLRGRMNAEDWAHLMRETADILDARQRRMEWEKFAIVRIH